MEQEQLTLKEKIVNTFDVVFSITIGAALMVGGFTWIITNHTPIPDAQVAAATQSSPKETTEMAPPKPNPFDNLTLEASSVYVWDINEKKALYSKASDTAMPLASLTKIMTALTALDIAPDSTVVTISDDAVGQEGDTGLAVGEQWSLRNLLDFTLLVSSNDGARAIAAAIGAIRAAPMEQPLQSFVREMNNKAAYIGLRNTKFYNESGLDVSADQAGAYGTAEDVAQLVEYALRNEPHVLSSTRNAAMAFSSLDEIDHAASNTNSILSKIPGVIASKTGYSALAGGNLVVALDVGVQKPIVIVVLGSSFNGRFTDMETLVNATLKYFTQEG